MNTTYLSLLRRVIIFTAIVFGIMTIISGTAILFFEGPARSAAGNYVAFVIWFNFIAAFAYVATGIGIWRSKRWSLYIAAVIALSTLLVFIAFAIHVMMGGAYEPRTVFAMSFRFLVWLGISITIYYLDKRQPLS